MIQALPHTAAGALTTEETIRDLTTAMRAEFELEQEKLAARQEENRLKALTVQAQQEQTRALQAHVAQAQQQLDTLTEMMTRLTAIQQHLATVQAAVAGIAQTVVTQGYAPVAEQLTWMQSRIEIILHLFAGTIPEIFRANDPRHNALREKFLYFLDHPTAATAPPPGVHVNVGDANVNFSTKHGTIQGMTVQSGRNDSA